MNPSQAIRTLVAATTLALAGATGAHAAVLLGASFGYTHASFPNVDDLSNNVIAVPSNSTSLQPGLRIGYATPSGRWDLNADIGFMRRSGSDNLDITALEFFPQVQVNSTGPGRLNMFANAGVGVEYENHPLLDAATRPVFGVGIGARKSVSDGHGVLRVELRYDHLPETDDPPGVFSTGLETVTLYSVKLGFDLLLSQ